MNQRIKKMAKRLAPPVALDIYLRLRGGGDFSGNYRTWEEARRVSGGYDSDVILEKVKNALLKVKKGEAVYERDSVLFDKFQYSWPMLAGLLWIASREDNKLNLIDFGGSLGSTYYQNIKFLNHLKELKWSIVEQIKFVECGKQDFENEHIKFYSDLNECIVDRHPDTILFSSVIQYLEKPYAFLKEVMDKRFKHIIFDRTSFLEKGDDRITVQEVPPDIYPASYPVWFLNQKKFLDYFTGEYELIADFESNDRANVPSVFKGYIFELKR